MRRAWLGTCCHCEKEMRDMKFGIKVNQEKRVSDEDEEERRDERRREIVKKWTLSRWNSSNFPWNCGMAMLNLTKQAHVMTRCGIMNFNGRETV